MVDKAQVKLYLTPELAKELRVRAARRGGQGAQSALVEEILREAFGMTETRFHIDPMERTALMEIDQSASPVALKTPFLEFDARTGSVEINLVQEVNRGSVPMAVYHGFILRWPLTAVTDAERLSEAINAGKLDTLLSRIMKGASAVWDGDNNVCSLTEDADAAVEKVGEWLTDRPTLEEPAGLWEAGDWFIDGVEGITAATTDSELEAMAEKLEAEALKECVVLAGTVRYLRGLRDTPAK